jgi:hypothetical protein
MGRSRQERGATEELPGREPIHKYLSPVACQHEVPALTTGENEESLSRIPVMDHDRGCKELPMGGGREDSVECGLWQAR